jgi:hypothetical protein
MWENLKKENRLEHYVLFPLVISVNLAYIPLPSSPIQGEEIGIKRDNNTKNTDEFVHPVQPNLRKQSSMGSSLSMNQKYGNMHHGVHAYHDPPVENLGTQRHSIENMLHTEKKKSRKNTNAKDSYQPRKSETKLDGNLRMSNNSLNRSGSLPQINHPRISVRK